VPEQISVLLAVTGGVFDDLSTDEVSDAEYRVRGEVTRRLPAVCERIRAGEKLSPEDRESILDVARNAAPEGKAETHNGNH
jgi:F-type H+-transporting ATPase subunit alpha